MSKSTQYLLTFLLIVGLRPDSLLAEEPKEVTMTDQNGCKVWAHEPITDESVRWSGACREGWADGYGKAEYSHSGQIYYVEEGAMSQGRMNGLRKFNNLKTSFSGEVAGVNGKYQGFGELRNTKGFRYLGELSESRAAGIGMASYEDGSKYIGQWKDGHREGNGVMILTSGDRAQGVFEDDNLTGPVKYRENNGTYIALEFGVTGAAMGSACQQIYPDGVCYTGRIKRPPTGGWVCEKTAGEKITSFFFDSTCNSPAPASSDPFGYVDRINQMQVAHTARLQALERALAAQALLASNATSPQQNVSDQSGLPVQVQADLRKRQIEKQIVSDAGAGRNAAALQGLSAYHALNVPIPPPLLFTEAKLSFAEHDSQRAKGALEAYFKAAKQDDQDYSEALDLYQQCCVGSSK
jgi:hypothetical protein